MFFIYDHHLRGALGAIIVVHLALGWWGIQNMGVLEATAGFWTESSSSQHPLSEHIAGLFVASCSPPVESLRVGSSMLPIWTTPLVGAIGDWPGRALYAVGASHAAIMAMNLGLSCVLIALVHRFVRLHGSAIAANAAATLLATDWVYVFLRRALGGTEILLSASALLCLWALWSRRWGGGRHGLTALALGAGIGLTTHIAFALTVTALVVTALVMRWDKPALRPPLPSRWMPVTLALAVPLLPMVIGLVHHAVANMPDVCGSAIGWNFPVRSLDGAALPLNSEWPLAAAWIGEGLSFLHLEWGAQAPAWMSPLRILGWIILLGGTVVAWRDTNHTPRFALARFCSVFVPIQVMLTTWMAPSLQHLSIATPMLMIWAGLATEAIFGFFAPPRSLRRAIAVFIGCLPWAVAGTHSIATTDATLSTIPQPTIAADAQQSIADLVAGSGATRVTTVALSPTGFLSVLLPAIEFHHAKVPEPGPTADHSSALHRAIGGHLLAIDPVSKNGDRPTTPLGLVLETASKSAGVVLVEDGRLPDGAAVLYAVDSQTGQP